MCYLSTSFSWDHDAQKVFFCSFDCYLEHCLESEFFPRQNDEDGEPRDEMGFELYKEQRKTPLALELLENSGVQNFIERNKIQVGYKAPPKKMKVEDEIKSWADM
jgi:hypothetical protein